MLTHWTSHNDYQDFIAINLVPIYILEPSRVERYVDDFSKLFLLNLDPLYELLAPYYSHTGTPAQNQPEIFRSFILMMLRKETSITKRVSSIKKNQLLAIAIGCEPDAVPSLGAHYDFLNRLWLVDPSIERTRLKNLYSFNKKPSSKSAPGKNNKLPNKKPGVVKRICDFFLNDRSFSNRPELLLQTIFASLAVKQSVDFGLINPHNLFLAGDGTCVHTHSSSYGIKICDCRDNGIFDCKCHRRFSDPDATWGWDSHEAQWFYGYTLYALSVYNSDEHMDLPVYLRYVSAKRHDSVTGVVALAEFRELLPEFSPSAFIADSANDNYPTYDLCSQWNIKPFIDLNDRCKDQSIYPSSISVTDNGTPICMGNHEMIYNGFCPDRSRIKWRCPLALGKIDSCEQKCNCSPSDYGRVIYTKPSWDLRLFTPVPRGSAQWKSVFKTRTCSERINNRILNNYNIHAIRCRTKKRYSFFTTIAGICIHLDAWIKSSEFSILQILNELIAA